MVKLKVLQTSLTKLERERRTIDEKLQKQINQYFILQLYSMTENKKMVAKTLQITASRKLLEEKEKEIEGKKKEIELLKEEIDKKSNIQGDDKLTNILPPEIVIKILKNVITEEGLDKVEEMRMTSKYMRDIIDSFDFKKYYFDNVKYKDFIEIYQKNSAMAEKKKSSYVKIYKGRLKRDFNLFDDTPQADLWFILKRIDGFLSLKNDYLATLKRRGKKDDLIKELLSSTRLASKEHTTLKKLSIEEFNFYCKYFKGLEPYERIGLKELTMPSSNTDRTIDDIPYVETIEVERATGYTRSHLLTVRLPKLKNLSVYSYHLKKHSLSVDCPELTTFVASGKIVELKAPKLKSLVVYSENDLIEIFNKRSSYPLLREITLRLFQKSTVSNEEYYQKRIEMRNYRTAQQLLDSLEDLSSFDVHFE